MKYNDDEIQFLGGEDVKRTPSPKSTGKRWWIIAAASILLAAASIVGYIVWQNNRWAVSFEYPLSRSSQNIISDLSSEDTDTLAPGITLTTDSINDVALRIYQLHRLKASISTTLPADSDTTVCLAIRAWDYYYDDSKQYHYLGDFVLNGVEKSRGNNKAGFVAILGDKWQMGISPEDSVKQYIQLNHGSMYRQFALVSAGQICLKQFALKGKVTRCALARKSGDKDFYYIESINRESLYDFADALADYGFTDAIYVTGGNTGNTFWRNKQGEVQGAFAKDLAKGKNLIIFRYI